MSGRLIGHVTVDVTEMLALVHAQGASAATETVALRPVFTAVALATEDVATMLRQVGALKILLAQATLEAHFVPFLASGKLLFGRVDRFAAFRAFLLYGWLERHAGQSSHKGHTDTRNWC